MAPRAPGRYVSTFSYDPARQVIPRWRFLSDRHVLPETAGDPRRPNRARPHRSYLDQKRHDWQEFPSLGTAADLLAGALATGEHDAAVDAAEFIVNEKARVFPTVAGRAERFLASRKGTLPEEKQRSLLLVPDSTSAARAAIRRSRIRLSGDARNMEAWLDLSRAYAVLGHRRLSKRAMTRALMVAPDHRLSLRAAARLYVHYREPERALSLVSRHSRTRTDPWLLATELALNSMLDRTSRLVRHARDLIESDHFPASQLTELHGALAAMEFSAGSFRGARRHTRASLIKPNDNAVAQARWVATRIGGVEVESAAHSTANSYEARCWLSLENEEWSRALSDAHAWLLDEPFSSRPAIQSSFIAVSLMEDYALAAGCAQVGLLADPRSGTLLNNLAVALAFLGEMKNAWMRYREIPMQFSDAHPEYVHIATAGLLHFRDGRPEVGRDHYRRAAEKAPPHRRWLVLAHWIKEELEADRRMAAVISETCRTLSKVTKDPMAGRLIQLVQGRAEQILSIERAGGLPALYQARDSDKPLTSVKRIAEDAARQDNTSRPRKHDPNLPIM